MAETTHIVVIAGPGFTHLVPILNFSKRLVNLHPDFHVSCIIPSLGSPPSASKSILETLPPNISSTFLPPVSPNDLPQGVANEVQMQLTVTYSLPSIHETLKSLTSNTTIVAMVVDSFAFETLDFAQEFNMLSYVYFPAAATTLSVLMHLPKMDEETSCEYRDLPYPIKVPGCVPLHGTDLYTPVQDRTNLVYKLLLQRVKRYSFVDGIFINSFLEMEAGPITALKDEERGYPTMYPVGPLVQTGTDSAKGLECLTWLDKQEAGSVLYVSFGSGGTLSQEQMTELAHGLELSNHKFLWAVRAPNDVANAAYLSSQNHVDPVKFLPSGFLERTKEQGMVVPSWAPQIQILSHSSVGGFLTHCGWNSTLESVLNGVPLVTWPLFAEQRMNAVVLSESLKVGVRPKGNENGLLVEREEIGDVMKRLMEGVEGVKFRNRMKELKEAATNTLKENGDSTKTLSELALKWKSLA